MYTYELYMLGVVLVNNNRSGENTDFY